MNYWQSVLNEVRSHGVLCFSDDEDARIVPRKKAKKIACVLRRTYSLGDRYPNVYFTKREAECFFWLAQDLTIAATSCRMDLSPRTVEFYVKNMKSKLNIHSKKILIQKVLQTDLLQQLEKDGMCIVRH